MAMTEIAATRSPRNLAFKERRDADNPGKKRAGIVPNPKENIVRSPPMGLCVVAALMIIAQESMQGKNPAASPKATLLTIRRDRKREGSQRRNRDPGLIDWTVIGRGKIFKCSKPNRMIKTPPMSVRPLRSPAKN